MKTIFKTLVVLVLVGLHSCGDGADVISMLGVCDGYSPQASSNYKLPWAAGSTFAIAQGNCSPISHYGVSRYAYDVSMNIGTAVHASRAGTVIAIKEDESDYNGCPNANYVKIRHADNTVAGYYHLTRNGASVNVGDAIAQGQAIGLSGSTGCSTGPHLHFIVWRDSNEADSMAATFQNTTANPRGLKSGTSYLAQ